MMVAAMDRRIINREKDLCWLNAIRLDIKAAIFIGLKNKLIVISFHHEVHHLCDITHCVLASECPGEGGSVFRPYQNAATVCVWQPAGLPGDSSQQHRPPGTSFRRPGCQCEKLLLHFSALRCRLEALYAQHFRFYQRFFTA